MFQINVDVNVNKFKNNAWICLVCDPTLYN